MNERIIDTLNRWRWPITVGFALFCAAFLSLGFGWPLTPTRQFMELRAQDAMLSRVDSVNKKEVLDSLAVLRAEVRETNVVIVGTGLYRCLHSSVTELQTLRIKKWCDAELGNR